MHFLLIEKYYMHVYRISFSPPLNNPGQNPVIVIIIVVINYNVYLVVLLCVSDIQTNLVWLGGLGDEGSIGFTVSTRCLTYIYINNYNDNNSNDNNDNNNNNNMHWTTTVTITLL